MEKEIKLIGYKELVPNNIIRADIESRTFDYNDFNRVLKVLGF